MSIFTKVPQLRRNHEVVLVPLEDLVIDEDFEPDDAFTERFVRCALGDATLAYSRLPLDEIQAGGDGPEGEPVVSPPPEAAHVQRLAAAIRQGRRPPLHVYARQAERDGPRFVSSDDHVALGAYRQLRLHSAPVVVLDIDEAMPDLRHGALEFKSLPGVPETGFNAYVGPRRPESELVQLRFQHIEDPPNPLDALSTLEQDVTATLENLRSFHQEGGDLHYHESLASALVRAARLLAAMRHHIKQRSADLATPFARGLYELALSIYLDWLAPETVGRLFYAFCATSRGKRQQALMQLQQDRVLAGWPKAAAVEATHSINRQLKLIESASRRAAVNPLAPLHGRVYAGLGHDTHQDYLASIRFVPDALSGQAPHELVPFENRLHGRFLVQVADMSARQIVSCIDADLPHPAE